MNVASVMQDYINAKSHTQTCGMDLGQQEVQEIEPGHAEREW